MIETHLSWTATIINYKFKENVSLSDKIYEPIIQLIIGHKCLKKNVLKENFWKFLFLFPLLLKKSFN